MKFAKQRFGLPNVRKQSKRRRSKLRHKLRKRIEGPVHRLLHFDFYFYNPGKRSLKPLRGVLNLSSKIFHHRGTQFLLGVIAGILFWLLIILIFKLTVNSAI